MNPFTLVLVTALCLLSSLPDAAAQQENVQVARFSGPDETHHSYFINGLASAIPEIGYGLRNLSENLGGKHYSYLSPVESTGPIQILVLSDIRKRLRENPLAKINLIGISYGGNIATLIAQQLNLYKIPVNYLAILDAPAPVPINSNVHRVDNFYCRKIGCIGQRVQLAWGNKDTIKEEFKIKSGHIQLSATKTVETRITGQLSEIILDLDPAKEEDQTTVQN